MNEIGGRIPGDGQKRVVRKRTCVLVADEFRELAVDSRRQLLRQHPVLMEGFPLELPVGLVHEDGTRNDQRNEEKSEPQAQFSFGKP